MIAPVSYDTIEDVKEAFIEEDLDRGETVQVLIDEFDMDLAAAETLVGEWAEVASDDEDDVA